MLVGSCKFMVIVSVMLNNVKFVTMIQTHRLLLAPSLKIPTKSIINLTAAKYALFIYLHAINALNNMLGKPSTNSAGGGITIILMIGNFKDLNLACKNIVLVIFLWQTTTGF